MGVSGSWTNVSVLFSSERQLCLLFQPIFTGQKNVASGAGQFSLLRPLLNCCHQCTAWPVPERKWEGEREKEKKRKEGEGWISPVCMATGRLPASSYLPLGSALNTAANLIAMLRRTASFRSSFLFLLMFFCLSVFGYFVDFFLPREVRMSVNN